MTSQWLLAFLIVSSLIACYTLASPPYGIKYVYENRSCNGALEKIQIYPTVCVQSPYDDGVFYMTCNATHGVMGFCDANTDSCAGNKFGICPGE